VRKCGKIQHSWRGASALHAGYLRLQTHTHTLGMYFPTATVVTRTRLIVKLYVHCLSCSARSNTVMPQRYLHLNTALVRRTSGRRWHPSKQCPCGYRGAMDTLFGCTVQLGPQINIYIYIYFVPPCGAAAQRGPWPPHS